MSQPAIKVEGLSKRYKLGLTHAGSIREAVNRGYRKLLGKRDAQTDLATATQAADPSRVDEDGCFWALKDVSFEVQPGEVVGIIGRNGAGKSTLLKILSRITKPTAGRVTLRGRVASLLEVGTGFHPELTGRENVYMNGTILGMTKREIDRRFDEIVAFAEVEKFIDTPVKRYSSGMQVKLAFAVAAHLEPEILIVDEVLAVGDAAFQEKCIGKINDVACRAGRTVLVVSHSMKTVRVLCQQGMVLKGGHTTGFTSVERAIAEYLDTQLQTSDGRIQSLGHDVAPAHIKSVWLQDKQGVSRVQFWTSDAIDVFIHWENRRGVAVNPAITLETEYGMYVAIAMDTPIDPDGTAKQVRGSYCSRVRIPPNWLNAGHYAMHLSLDSPSPRSCHDKQMSALRFDVEHPEGVSMSRGSYQDRFDHVAILPALDWRWERLPGNAQEER